MSSFKVLPVDSEDLRRIFGTSLNIDTSTQDPDVIFLLGLIDGVLGKYFTTKKEK